MGRDKVSLYARIREDQRQLGLGVRALARRHGVHRRVVREALASPVPAPRKTPVRHAPVLGCGGGKPWRTYIWCTACLLKASSSIVCAVQKLCGGAGRSGL
jgi:hypothetical protein